MTRQRSASTSSGQSFDYRSVAWVDGLERESARSAVVQLMLLMPDAYEGAASTSLERQDIPRKDATEVPSLWAYAIEALEWSVIPTTEGPAPVADSWLIDTDQRGLARRRLALLSQVRSPFDRSTRLLERIGVTTLQHASVGRLLHALDSLGRRCEGLDAESRRIAWTLAEDLFSHLQRAFARDKAGLPDLSPFILPLEQNGVATGVLGSDISVAYLNDDPVRAQFIPEFANSLVWQLQTRYAYSDLVDAIRDQLGDDSVIFTSRAEVDTRFEEHDPTSRVFLLDWLQDTFQMRPVACDLACLIAYGGQRETDPNGEEFKRVWQLLQKAQLAFGRFPPDAQTRYFYDRKRHCLELSGVLTPTGIVEATWMLIGQSYQPTWIAYAKELEGGDPDKILASYRVTSAERENVETAIGLTSAERFRHIRAAVYALLDLDRKDFTQPHFDEEWERRARSAADLSAWINRPELTETIAECLGHDEETAAIAIMRATGMDSARWQQARASLGMPRWRFSQKALNWHEASQSLVAILKTCAARSATSSLSDVEAILRDTRVQEASDDEASCWEDGDGVRDRAARALVSVLDQAGDSPGLSILRRRLAAIREQIANGANEIVLDDAPIRDVRVYRHDDETTRDRDALARVDGLMRVALAVSAVNAEELDEGTIRNNPRVALLTRGWWSNSFTVMTAVQRTLQDKAPKTAQLLSDKRVFRDPAPANELLARFAELVDSGTAGPAPKPKREVDVLGENREEDAVDADLLRGSAGDIGRKLQALAAEQPPADLAHSQRNAALEAGSGGRRRGGSGGGGGKSTGNKKDRELAGLLGEAYVYEQLRQQLPGFDERAWQSANRARYGLEGEGDDSLGYDFVYQDYERHICPDADHCRCHIEVKSSSGDGTEPFQMSANEWDNARTCHEQAGLRYIVIRVAHVRDAPAIVDVIHDPFGLYREGRLVLSASDMWVRVGNPVEEADECEPGTAN